MNRIGPKPAERTRAFTLLEALVSTFVVSVMLVAALNTLGASKLGAHRMEDSARGVLLAQALMAEILPQSYLDPVDPPQFGLEAGEVAGIRATFDDVDDYHGWSSSPPRNPYGSVIPDRADWGRSVTVQWADPANLVSNAVVDTGIKRITVTVTRGGEQVARLGALRTLARDNANGS